MNLLWFRRARRDERTRDAAQASLEPQERAPLRLRGLLLLNLQPGEGREQIEHAPPLGSREVVITAMQTLVPGIRFDDSGRGRAAGADHHVEVEIATDDPVRVAVAAAEGRDGIQLLRSVVHNQGWRVYAPRAGVFVEADALETFAAGQPS